MPIFNSNHQPLYGDPNLDENALRADSDDKLDNELDPPGAPATDIENPLPPDHPRFDAELDSHELYDEGPTGATDFDAMT